MRLYLGAVLAASVWACSDDDGGTPGAGENHGGATTGGATTGGATTSGAPGDAGAGGTSNPQPVAIWNEASARLRVVSGDFFSGYSGYERARDELSATLLAELAELRTAPSLDLCEEDGLTIAFTVTDRNGTTATYFSDSCQSMRQLVDPDAAEHLLESLPPCLRSKDARSSALETAPSVAVGDGCLNGLFTSSAGEESPLFLRLDVTTTDVPIELELTECGQRELKLELLDPEGETVLATGASTATSCQALSHSFSELGRYVVRVTLVAGPGAGDFWFRAN
jgi:hypothetical protein